MARPSIRDRLARHGPAALLSVVAMVAAAALLFQPLLQSPLTMGFHDWDHHAAYRYFTILSLVGHGEWPWWHPHLCGGYPAWGFFEGAPNLVSPFLPAYLTLPLPIAIRIEVIGCAAIGIVATFALARRYTRSVPVSAFVTVAATINGRWALQAAAGHTWHLYYCWLPVAWYLFDRAISAPRPRLLHAAYAGVPLALMVYGGAMYPLPHTALALTLYALALAVQARTWQPIVAVALAGVTAAALSAPKLLPVLDTIARHPRPVDSPEALSLADVLAALTSRDQAFDRANAAATWGWHESGLYVGWAGLLLLAAGVLVPSADRRVRALKAVGLVLLLLGLGAFARHAPWSLLHAVPPFSSQHVPSRFLYPAAALLAVAAAPGIESLLLRLPRLPRHVGEVAFAVAACAIFVDIALVGRKALAESFQLAIPQTPSARAFQQHRRSRFRYGTAYHGRTTANPYTFFVKERSELLATMANEGAVDCYWVPRAESAVVPVESRRYRGEVFLVHTGGTASVVAWTPSRAVVALRDVSAGGHLVYNMNFDPHWRADGRPVASRDGLVAVPVAAGTTRVVLEYVPPGLGVGCGLAAVACAALVAGAVRARRRRSGSAGAT